MGWKPLTSFTGFRIGSSILPARGAVKQARATQTPIDASGRDRSLPSYPTCYGLSRQ